MYVCTCSCFVLVHFAYIYIIFHRLIYLDQALKVEVEVRTSPNTNLNEELDTSSSAW